MKNLAWTLIENESPAVRGNAAIELGKLGEGARPAARFLDYSCDHDHALVWETHETTFSNNSSMAMSERRTVGSIACDALHQALGVDVATLERTKKEWEEHDLVAVVKLPRLTLHVQYAPGPVVVENDWDKAVAVHSFEVTLGYRKNYTRTFGLDLRLGVGGGVAVKQGDPDSNGDTHTSDSTSVGEVFAQIGPYVGPWRSFYIGPTVWCSRLTFARNTLQTPESTYTLEDGWRAGLGLDMGLFVHDALVLDWGVASTLNKQIPFRLWMGVGYHFM